MRRASGPRAIKPPTTRAAVLAQFDSCLKTARQNLVNKTDAEFAAMWTLKNSGKEVFSAPKAMVMRNFVLNHMIHHRGQFVVYLRMLGVPVPSIYGPSGDEQMSQPHSPRLQAGDHVPPAACALN